jgi:hypothetical protein
MKQIEKLSKEVERRQIQLQVTNKCNRQAEAEAHVYKKISPLRPISADGFNLLSSPAAAQMANIHLYLYGERRFTIEVPESVTRLDRRRRASQHFNDRVRTVPDVFPPKDDTIVHCIPSFVPETNHPKEEEMTVIPHLVHHEHKYPIQIWPDITRNGLIIAASNIMNGPCHVHDSATYSVKTNDEILIVTEQEVKLIEIKFAALRKDEEARAEAQAPPTMRQLTVMAPQVAMSREILPPTIAFQPPVPQSANVWGARVKITFRDCDTIIAEMKIRPTPIPEIKPMTSVVNAWITAAVQDLNGYSRNVGTRQDIDRNLMKQQVLDLWHRTFGQQEEFSEIVARFPSDAGEPRWKDHFRGTVKLIGIGFELGDGRGRWSKALRRCKCRARCRD